MGRSHVQQVSAESPADASFGSNNVACRLVTVAVAASYK
jgi:hypothetical protein